VAYWPRKRARGLLGSLMEGCTRERVTVAYILAESTVYGRCDVTKRLIDLDDELLAAAQRELHTSGVSDTVRAALQHAATATARARQVQWLADGGLAELAGEERRAAVWR
jgi:Arc/MetJ family transcription regulator